MFDMKVIMRDMFRYFNGLETQVKHIYRRMNHEAEALSKEASERNTEGGSKYKLSFSAKVDEEILTQNEN